MINLLEGDVVNIADSDGSQHVVEVIGTNKVGLYLHPLAGVARIVVLLAPAELQERCTRDDLATNQDVLVVTLAVVVDVGLVIIDH